MGINAYDSISEHLDKLEKGKIRVGKKVKEVYMIEVDGNELGYVEPVKDAAAYVGNMTFNSPEVKTEEGIGVGSTFAEVLAAYPKLKVKNQKLETGPLARSESCSSYLTTKQSSRNCL